MLRPKHPYISHIFAYKGLQYTSQHNPFYVSNRICFCFQRSTIRNQVHRDETIELLTLNTSFDAESKIEVIAEGDTSSPIINGQRQSRRRSSEIEVNKSHRSSSNSNQPLHFQKRREKSARVLITIVLTFLVCHVFRFALKVYEVTHPSHSTAEHHYFCLQQNKYHVPVIWYVLLSLHHLLLVVNSSVNFVIYCCVGKRFRQELTMMMAPICNFLCRPLLRQQ